MTGSRTGINSAALEKLIKFLKDNKIDEAHHGDCVGSDANFHNEASILNIKTVIHPPINNKMRAYCQGDESRIVKPYLARNKDIVNETDMLIAFPPTKKEILKSGTWSTIRYAKKINKKVLIIYPDGEEEMINY